MAYRADLEFDLRYLKILVRLGDSVYTISATSTCCSLPTRLEVIIERTAAESNKQYVLSVFPLSAITLNETAQNSY